MAENKKCPLRKVYRDDDTLIRLGLGICPAIAVTTNAFSGLTVGISTAAVLVCSTLLVAVLGKLITDRTRVPALMVVIGALAAVAQLIVKAYWPERAAALGIYFPTVAVSAMLLIRPECFNGDESTAPPVLEAIGMGVGFICAITLASLIREIIAYGSMFGQAVVAENYETNAFAVLPAGGFMLLGILVGLYNATLGKCSRGKEDTTT